MTSKKNRFWCNYEKRFSQTIKTVFVHFSSANAHHKSYNDIAFCSYSNSSSTLTMEWREGLELKIESFLSTGDVHATYISKSFHAFPSLSNYLLCVKSFRHSSRERRTFSSQIRAKECLLIEFEESFNVRVRRGMRTFANYSEVRSSLWNLTSSSVVSSCTI